MYVGLLLVIVSLVTFVILYLGEYAWLLAPQVNQIPIFVLLGGGLYLTFSRNELRGIYTGLIQLFTKRTVVVDEQTAVPKCLTNRVFKMVMFSYLLEWVFSVSRGLIKYNYTHDLTVVDLFHTLSTGILFIVTVFLLIPICGRLEGINLTKSEN